MQFLSRLQRIAAGLAVLSAAGLALAGPQSPGPLGEVSVPELIERLGPQEATTRGLRNIVPAAYVDLRVQFEFDSVRVQAGSQPLLTNLARALNSDRLAGRRVVLEGHTDARGSAAYNDSLSLRRAESVADFLVRQGVDRTRIDSRGLGFRDLLRPDQPAAVENRRVRVQVLP